MDFACKAFVPIDPSITSSLIEQTYGGNKDDESEKKLSLVIIKEKRYISNLMLNILAWYRERMDS